MPPCKSSHKVIISEDKAALLCSNTSLLKIAAAITIAIAVGAATAGFAASTAAAAAAVGTVVLVRLVEAICQQVQ